jgi:hypothetical protein
MPIFIDGDTANNNNHQQQPQTVQCTAASDGSQLTIDCHSNGIYFAKVNDRTGDVYCEFNAAIKDQVVRQNENQISRLTTLSLFPIPYVAVGALMLIISGKGLMKARRWAFKVAERLTIVMMASSALMIFIMPLAIQKQQEAAQTGSSDITSVSSSFASAVAGVYVIFGIVGIISFFALRSKPVKQYLSSHHQAET